MTEPTACCRADGNYCDRCDLGNAQVCATDLAIAYMDGQPDGFV